MCFLVRMPAACCCEKKIVLLCRLTTLVSSSDSHLDLVRSPGVWHLLAYLPVMPARLPYTLVRLSWCCWCQHESQDER